jgi:hypothetical protein
MAIKNYTSPSMSTPTEDTATVRAVQYVGTSASIADIETLVGSPVSYPDTTVYEMAGITENIDYILMTVTNPTEGEADGALPVHLNEWVVEQLGAYFPYTDEIFTQIYVEVV